MAETSHRVFSPFTATIGVIFGHYSTSSYSRFCAALRSRSGAEEFVGVIICRVFTDCKKPMHFERRTNDDCNTVLFWGLLDGFSKVSVRKRKQDN